MTIIGSTTAFAVGSITSSDKTTESRPQMSMKLRGDRGGKSGFENRGDKETLMLERQEAEAAQTAFDSIIAHMTEKLSEINEMVSDLQ